MGTLRLMFPGAEVPVVQLSIQHTLDPASHFALGEAHPGTEGKGVLILGSGGAVHPLGNPYASLGPGAPTDDWAREFNTWLTDAITRGEPQQPYPLPHDRPVRRAGSPVPRSLHASSCGSWCSGTGCTGTVLHQSRDLGDLGMGAFEFTH